MIYFVSKYHVPNTIRATLEQCLAFLKTLKVVGIDIETSVNEQYRHLQTKVYKGGLDPYLSRVVMLQLGDIETQYVIDTRQYSNTELSPLISFLHYNKDVVFVGHNLKFEALHLKHNMGVEFCNIWDTMLCEITLYNGLPMRFGLADLAERYLGITKAKELSLFENKYDNMVTMDEELLAESEHYITPFDVEDDIVIDKSTRLQFINIADKPFTEKQILYGADDIVYPLLIRERQMVGRRLDDGVLHCPKNWQHVENHYCLVLADIELAGIAVDKEMWEQLHEDNYKIYKQREEVLNQYVLKNFPQYSAGTIDMFDNKVRCFISWSSSTQVVKFFKSLNKCPKAYSKQKKRVEYTVGATELTRVLPNDLKVKYERNQDTDVTTWDTFVLAYLLFKKSEQAITTFGKEWLKYIHPLTQRAHTKYKQILNTTRISSSNPNLNNISGGAWRACFHVGDGKVLVNADAANQEVRVLSSKSGDEALMNFFINGDDFFGNDFHSYTATNVYRVKENNPSLVVPPKEIKGPDGELIKNPAFTADDGNRRTDSKSITFGLAFGKSVFTFAADLGMDITDTQNLLDSYFEAFPGLKEHFERCEKNANNKSYIIIDEFTGAAWFCPFIEEMRETFKEAWAFFPADYSRLSKKDRESIKATLYKENPQIKTLFQKAGRLKSQLVNKNKNFPIQGACAQMLKISMCIFRKKRIEENLPFLLVGNIYDEVLVETDEHLGQQAGTLVKYSMETGGRIIDQKVPQVADFALSKDWKH